MLPLNPKYCVTPLRLENGQCPYETWFNALPAEIAAKVSVAMYRMELGNLSRVEWFRGIGEYKIDFGAGWRIYLAKSDQTTIVLLGGGSKRGQQADINRAVGLWLSQKNQ